MATAMSAVCALHLIPVTFSAPSTVAAVVLGRSANGRVEWKGADGRTLKEIQEAEAGL
jgi:hypothetical protein